LNMAITLALIIPIVFVALLFFIVAGIRNVSTQGGEREDMIKNVYIYLVLFATLMMTIGGSVGVFMAAADIIAPTPYHQTFEEFKRWGFENEKIDPGKVINEAPKPSEQELKARYDAMVASENERAIARAKNSLIKSLGWIVIPLPVFVYFQRRLTNKEIKY
jgi:hypothetical protein